MALVGVYGCGGDDAEDVCERTKAKIEECELIVVRVGEAECDEMYVCTGRCILAASCDTVRESLRSTDPNATPDPARTEFANCMNACIEANSR